ncbi:hypothetical protein Hanom_Chr16g01430051 [Helianthus anomalus]
MLCNALSFMGSKYHASISYLKLTCDKHRSTPLLWFFTPRFATVKTSIATLIFVSHIMFIIRRW